jgi:hypothetical protein
LAYEGQLIGTGSLLALFAEYYTSILDAKMPENFSTRTVEAYPSVNEEAIAENVAACKTWPVHREDLDMSQLIEMTRLQLWTLKPAHDINRPG